MLQHRHLEEAEPRHVSGQAVHGALAGVKGVRLWPGLIVRLIHGMQDGKAEIKVRRALLYYTLKRLGLDTDPSARKPQDQQIVLLNRETSFPAQPAERIGEA